MNLTRVMTGLTRSGISGASHVGFLAHRALNAGQTADTQTFDGARTIGRIAWEASNRYQLHCGKTDANDSSGVEWSELGREHFLPADPYSRDFYEFLLMRAMIAAAGSAGRISAGRRAKIAVRIGEMDMSADEKVFLINEISSPLSRRMLLEYAQGPDLATLVYTASLLATDPSSPASNRYLGSLATALGLPEGLIRAVHNRVDAARSTSGTCNMDAAISHSIKHPAHTA